MEIAESLQYLLSATLLLLLLLLLPKLLNNWPSGGRQKNRPPGPLSLPIIGHLHLIREPVHRSLKTLSDRYGPIFSISFGCRPVVVVSSPSAVEECLVQKDVAFSGRPKLESWREVSYNFTTIASASYGPHWRNLRRIATHNIFSRLDSFLPIRQDEVHQLLKSLRQSTGGGGGKFVEVGMRSTLRDLSFNVIMRMMAGKRFFGAEVKEEHAGEFKDIIAEVFELTGASDPGDFVPLLRLVDINGRRKRTIEAKRKLDAFFQRLIDERRNIKNVDQKTNTIIDSMLELQSSDPKLYTDDIIQGLILVLLGAGTESASLTVEWAMSVLLNNPDILRKARSEVDNCVGHDRLVNESDVQNLPYIQNIVTEVLRLFLPTPLLIPHEAMEDTTVGGFDIPKGTMLLVNAWAIHRDPKLWDDPTRFRPERHELGNDVGDGLSLRYLPYGVGRRSCPGAGYTNRLVGSTLAALIQCFEWERVGKEVVDLHEGTGMITPKAIPLQALCRTRTCMDAVLSHL